jgi:integrase
MECTQESLSVMTADRAAIGPAVARPGSSKRHHAFRGEPGLMSSLPGYTLRQAVEDWLAEGLPGRAVTTVAKNKYCVEPLLALIGFRLLQDLRAADIDEALGVIAESYTTAAVRVAHGALTRSVTYATTRSLVPANVAELVATPSGQPGRRRRALTAEQADLLLTVSKNTRMHAYIALSIAGIRAEEARSLRWDDVALDAAAPRAHLWRSVPARRSGGVLKAQRILPLPQVAAEALRAHRCLPEGRHELVFATRDGKQLDPANVRREFMAAVRAAGIHGQWTPTALRHVGGAAETLMTACTGLANCHSVGCTSPPSQRETETGTPAGAC